MSDSLQSTFQYLADTENRAAVDVLTAALDCPYGPSRLGTLRALLERREPDGHAEVFRRIGQLDDKAREIIDDRPERLVRAAVEALKNDVDGKACPAVCAAVVTLRLYDALPAMVTALVAPQTDPRELLAQAILKLTELFYGELSGTASPAAGGTASPAAGGTGEQRELKRRDSVRVRVTAGLEDAVRKFHLHQQPETVEALLLVAKQNNVALRRLLQNPREAAHQTMLDVMADSSRGGVIRLLLGFMEDARMPLPVLRVIAQRCDERFVGHLLRKIGRRPSAAVAETLKRFTSIAWAKPGHPLFQQLDEEAQQGAVGMLAHSSMDRLHVLEMLGYLLFEGNPGGRRAAAEALAEFDGAEADSVVIKALGDEDPQVRAQLIPQLRRRKIPGVFSLLVGLIDTQDEAVLQALRKAMPEFSLEQFMANYDKMDERLRPTAGQVVKQIDRGVGSKLAEMLQGPSPVRRRRAVAAVAEMGLVDELEPLIAGLLSDDDHMVRIVAARALADSKSVPSWEALRDAMFDRSLLVKEAAERSLESISQWLTQRDAETEDQPQEASP